MSQKPTRGFLRFLWVYIKSNGLEERTDHHQPTVDELENLDLLKLKEIMPIRCGIIEWILGYLKSDFQCKTVDSQLNSPEIMVKTAAVLLIALCCEDPAACLSRMSEKNCKSDENSTTFNPLHVSFWFSPTVVKISKEFGIVEKRSEIETSCWQDIKYQFPFHFFLKTIQQFVGSNVKGLRGITVEEPDTMVVLQGLNAARLLLHLALEWTFNDWETFVQSFEVVFSGISKLLKLFEISFKGNPQNNSVQNGIFSILNGINSVLQFLSSNSSPRKEKILEVIDRELQSFKEISLSLFRALIFAKKSATGCAGSNCLMSESFDELESSGFNDSFSSAQNLSDKVSGERSLIETLYEDVKGQNEEKKN
uniref:Uncharacterized protein n=1 Tax=Ciona savignyi TaxID=51511 RepID=H2YNG8_CIOSA